MSSASSNKPGFEVGRCDFDDLAKFRVMDTGVALDAGTPTSRFEPRLLQRLLRSSFLQCGRWAQSRIKLRTATGEYRRIWLADE